QIMSIRWDSMIRHPDLVIRMDIDEVSKLNGEGVCSDVYYAKDLTWKLKVRTEQSFRTRTKKVLGVYLHCNWESESSGWKCEVVMVNAVISRIDQGQEQHKFKCSFSPDSTNKGSVNLVPWHDLKDPRKGFILNDRITIECRVYVEKVTGVRKLNMIDYTMPADGHNNIVLIVEEMKLHVSKDYLAMYSTVFEDIFFGKYEEKNKEVEMELHDVKYEEFIDLLDVIYPTAIDINARTVGHILQLANRFDIQYVVERAESYLIETSKFKTLAKLAFADKYGLDELMDHCLALYTDLAALKTLKPSREYKGFSDKTKSAICDKMMDL
ncbi:hypothetical protein PFISCL1PPCAC_21322, partial [Pristionchus fissidentatus]